MANDRYIRIRQLPESTIINSSDYLIIDNDLDTWKIKIDVFNEYIRDIVQNKFDTDISSVINEKITEIHLAIKQTEELIKTLEDHVLEFENAEQSREEAERNREINEGIRQQFYDDNTILVNGWKDDEQDRKDAEQQRVEEWDNWSDVWDSWVATHNIWTNNENDRKTAETNRGIAETNRQTAEDNRTNAETDRQNAESDRVTEFNNMVNYFDDVKDSIDGYIKEGTTKPITPDDVVQILEFALPLNDKRYFSVLININSIFVGMTFMPVMNNNTLAGINTQYNVISSLYPEFDPTTIFQTNYKVDGNLKIISVEYKPIIEGSNTHVIGIWYDNLSRFKPTDDPIYSRVINQASIKSDFSPSNIPVVTGQTYARIPNAFINLIEKIITRIHTDINEVKAYVYYPIGSIYQTTKSANPSVLLGGGTWKLLYGNGISEGLTDNNGKALYSPVIYTWERIS